MPAAPMPAFRRGQRVLVSYGAVQVMSAIGKHAVSGYVRRRVPRKPDWFEVDLSVGTVDVGERLVTAHRSAITLNGYVS